MTMTSRSRTSERESEAVRNTSARWLEAAQTGDPQRAAAFYADDGVFFVPNAPPAQGRDAVTAVWAHLLSAPNLSLQWLPNKVEVAESGDFACEIGTYRLAMDGPSGRIEDEGKYVVVWRKSGEAWQVAADIFNSSRATAP